MSDNNDTFDYNIGEDIRIHSSSFLIANKVKITGIFH